MNVYFNRKEDCLGCTYRQRIEILPGICGEKCRFSGKTILISELDGVPRIYDGVCPLNELVRELGGMIDGT